MFKQLRHSKVLQKLNRFTFNKLTIKSKLLLMLLGVSMGSILVISSVSWYTGQKTLKATIFKHLVSIRSSKSQQFEQYFESLYSQLGILANDRMTISAMVELKKGFKQLNQQFIPSDWDEALEKHYEKEFFPKLTANIPGDLKFGTFRPSGQAARYLQRYYIVTNPNPVGEKDKLLAAEDGSDYSKFHATYHQEFAEILENFGFYDIFLIDHKTGDIIYSVYKETDYGTNLDNGPYASSGLAKAVNAVRENPEQGAVQIFDFSFYRPSYGAPAAFLATPIYNGPHMIGIFAVQLPVDRINDLMTDNQDWEAEGLGKTGETYLVGSDLLMRSVSRFLIETPEKYKQAIREQGVTEETIQLIENLETTIFLQKVDTIAAREALKGKIDYKTVKDYRGIDVLSAYSPLEIKGLDWVILSEMDVSEGYQPIYTLQRNLLIATILLIVLVTFTSNFASYIFVQPIETLIQAIRKATEGDRNVAIQLESEDELGKLAKSINLMTRRLDRQTELLEEKSRESDALLLNILPSLAAERLKKGDTKVTNNVRQATVLVAQIGSFTEFAEQHDASKATEILSAIISVFDSEAQKYDVDKIAVMGDRYVAVCGLLKPQLDHIKRGVDFALAMAESLQHINDKNGIALDLRLGMHAGAVQAGIVGGQNFAYTLWGEAFGTANELLARGKSKQILVSQAIYEPLKGNYEFSPSSVRDLDGIQVWQLIVSSTSSS